jgi:hypothetical protein
MSEMVKYCGRTVPKEGFRVWVHGKDSVKKLADSWDDYMMLVESGLWFSSTSDVPSEKPKAKARKRKG